MDGDELRIVASDCPEDDRRTILETLLAFNRQAAGGTQYKPFTLVLRDAAGNVRGGAYGTTFFRWARIEVLAIDAAFRGAGEGRRLLRAVEDMARREGCIGVWLDSYSFQAPGFYERSGFVQVGAIEDFPPGSSRHILAKRLAAQGPDS